MVCQSWTNLWLNAIVSSNCFKCAKRVVCTTVQKCSFEGLAYWGPHLRRFGQLPYKSRSRSIETSLWGSLWRKALHWTTIETEMVFAMTHYNVLVSHPNLTLKCTNHQHFSQASMVPSHFQTWATSITIELIHQRAYSPKFRQRLLKSVQIFTNLNYPNSYYCCCHWAAPHPESNVLKRLLFLYNQQIITLTPLFSWIPHKSNSNFATKCLN